MPDQSQRLQALKKAALAAFIEAVKAIPGFGDVLAAGATGASTYREALAESADLPEQARRALLALQQDYLRLLQAEADRAADAAAARHLNLALEAALELVSDYGLSAAELVAVGLQADRAARQTLERGAAVLDRLGDTAAQNLARRLVGDYYAILLQHQDAFDHVAIPALQRLLAGLDAVLAELARLREARPAEPHPPVNLPAAAPVFVGREQELADLEAFLTRPDGGAALIVGVRGMGGVGKTELALQVAHRLADRFAARLFVDATDKTAADLLADLLRACAPAQRPPDTLAERQALARRLMTAFAPGLLLLDNLTRPEAAQPVLAALPPGWAVLITSRRRFGLRGGKSVDLNLLPRPEAVALLRELDVAGPEEDLNALARACGRLPLALRVAAAFLRNHPDWTLAEYLQALREEGVARLREPGEGDVAAVLGLSLKRLEAEAPPSPPAGAPWPR